MIFIKINIIQLEKIYLMLDIKIFLKLKIFLVIINCIIVIELSAITDAIAAPKALYLGIKKKFNKKLIKAPMHTVKVKVFSL